MSNPFAVNLNLENIRNRYNTGINPTYPNAPVKTENESINYSVAYNSPDISGGTHITGLGKAGERYDSYNLWK